jgi:hypothetical protein
MNSLKPIVLKANSAKSNIAANFFKASQDTFFSKSTNFFGADDLIDTT